MLYKRVEADEKKGTQNIQWIDYNIEMLLTYNKMVHSSIGMTPSEAVKGKNDLKAKFHMATNAIRTRKYPEIKEEGDKVKIYRKKAITEKERTSQ